MVAAEGVYLHTADGGKILDAAGGAIVANIGHGDERVAKAVYEATINCTYVVPPWLTPSRQALADELHDHWLGDDFAHIHITSGGSEAVEAAVKIALQYQAAINQPQRTRIITREISYHGTTLATTAFSGHPARKKGLTQALGENPVTETPYLLRCAANDPGDYYVQSLEALIVREGAENIAAFLAEPITGSSGGALVPPDNYWPQVQALCKANGILIIMDEVMTGFGRTGTNFGYQHWNFTPDILIAGKGLAGGYAPLGGVYAPSRVAEPIFEAGFNVMFHTFGAHPAACAAAASVLKILRVENLVERARVMGDKLHNKLVETLGAHECVAEVRGKGLLQAVEIVANRTTLEPFALDANITGKIVNEGLKRGVFFYGGGTGDVRDIVCLGPPFILSDADIDTMAQVLHDAINAALP